MAEIITIDDPCKEMTVIRNVVREYIINHQYALDYRHTLDETEHLRDFLKQYIDDDKGGLTREIISDLDEVIEVIWLTSDGHKPALVELKTIAGVITIYIDKVAIKDLHYANEYFKKYPRLLKLELNAPPLLRKLLAIVRRLVMRK